MDGIYHAYLMVPSTGFNPRVVAGWTSIFVNAGEGIDVDFYFQREPKERIQMKLGQQIRINRSRIKDASDTNTDFDDIEGAIRSGYFLKQGLRTTAYPRRSSSPLSGCRDGASLTSAVSRSLTDSEARI